MTDVQEFVHQLINPATRENALLELSKKRENFPGKGWTCSAV